MAVTKIKKQNTLTPIYDARVPEIVAAGKVLKTVNEDGLKAEWADFPNELPAAETAGKFLKTVSANDEIGLEWGDAPVELPALPEGASEKTYVLKAVNGVLSWVEEVAAEVPAAAE